MKYRDALAIKIGSVRECARFYGLSPTTYSRLKRGYPPDPASLFKVMNALNIDEITICQADVREPVSLAKILDKTQIFRLEPQ